MGERVLLGEIMRKSLCVTLMCSIFIAGCGSLVRGPTQQIGFTSDPPGAKLTIEGVTTTTPAYLTLERKGPHVAYFSKEGYEPQVFALKEGMSRWFLFGNLGIGGIPGWIIDGINGSMGELSPKNVYVILTPQDETQPANSP